VAERPSPERQAPPEDAGVHATDQVPPPPASVLLVDDQRPNLDAFAAALDGLGATIVRAMSAREALEHVLERDFAVVLLDVEMPEIDGFDAARLIRGRERSRGTPIIFVTARDRDTHTTLAGYEAGAVDIMYKPVDPAILRAKIGIFIELFRLRGELVTAQRLRQVNTALRQAAAEADAARQRAEEADEAKDRFLATMSHEIRTPINAILGYAQLLEMGLAGPLADEQRKLLARLSASGQHLLGLVNDVLDIAKIEAGELRVAADTAWTGPIVAAVIELSAPMAAARQVALIDRRPGEAGEAFVGDEHRVRQILLNLISNAVKFTEPGGTVSVNCARANVAGPGTRLHGEGPWAAIEVADTGIGIAAEHLEQIFEPFHQVESGRTRTHGGTGLGLSISRRLARLMRGDLTIDSAPGKGSTLTLWLPGAQADESADRRSARATPVVIDSQVRGLCEIGEALRDEVHGVVRRYSVRLRADPETPRAAKLRQPDLEDHAVTFLADIAQSLIIVDEADAQAVDLLADASVIQRAIAERHGLRRHRQGWTEESVQRDFAVLRDEVERAVRGRIPANATDMEAALAVLNRLIDRAEEISRRAWREAEHRGGP
jgi:signal transduction histidine kinase